MEESRWLIIFPVQIWCQVSHGNGASGSGAFTSDTKEDAGERAELHRESQSTREPNVRHNSSERERERERQIEKGGLENRARLHIAHTEVALGYVVM